MFINGKNIHKIGIVLDKNLNFTIREFIWGLAKDLRICKKNEKPPNISFCLI